MKKINKNYQFRLYITFITCQKNMPNFFYYLF